MITSGTQWYVWLSTTCSLILHCTLLSQLIYYQCKRKEYAKIEEEPILEKMDNLNLESKWEQYIISHYYEIL